MFMAITKQTKLLTPGMGIPSIPFPNAQLIERYCVSILLTMR